MPEEKSTFAKIVISLSSKPEEIVLPKIEPEHIEAFRTGSLKYSWQTEREDEQVQRD